MSARIHRQLAIVILLVSAAIAPVAAIVAKAAAPNAPKLQPYRLVDEGKLTDEERRPLQVIETYRAEHTTWNIDKLRAIFADNATIWTTTELIVGNEAVDKQLVAWSTKGKLRRNPIMRHGLTFIRGNYAVVEFAMTGQEKDGKPIDNVGTNVYQLEGGKIKYLSISMKR